MFKFALNARQVLCCGISQNKAQFKNGRTSRTCAVLCVPASRESPIGSVLLYTDGSLSHNKGHRSFGRNRMAVGEQAHVVETPVRTTSTNVNAGADY